jgi:ATP-dependent DNA ligase
MPRSAAHHLAAAARTTEQRGELAAADRTLQHFDFPGRIVALQQNLAADQSSFDRCSACSQPVKASKPPAGTHWVHEIKHDGHRIIVRRDGPIVRQPQRE